MRIFFSNLHAIQSFTLQLKNIVCPHCHQLAFVSHGFIFRKCQFALPQKVGKRILCSNRFSNIGCGRTFQLYIASFIRYWRFNAFHLCSFLALLASNTPIHLAYSQACNAFSQRNAYRWLPRLLFAFSNSKALLPQALLLPTINSSKHLTRHFKSQRLLLITRSFQLFIQAWGPHFISDFQLQFQRHFFA